MRVEKRDGAVSRKVLTAMLVDDTVCGRIAAAWQDGAFPDRWSNVVASWAVEYHRKYDCAPGKNVEGLFAAWAPTADKDSAKLVEAYLTSLNGEYAKLKKGVNPDFVTDQANTLFEKARLERLAEQIQGDVAAGDVQKARRRIELSKPVEVGADAPVDVLGDPTALKAAFKNKAKPLFTLPGAAGNFFGKHLCRDGFLAFMGPEKVGKCVAGDTEVVLADGSVRTIAEIVRDEDRTGVLSLDEPSGRMVPTEPTQFWDNGLKECFALTTRTGRRVVTTANHKYLTQDGWKELSEVKVEDYVAVPKRIPVFGTTEVEEARVKFLAYMLAEGCTVASQPNFTNADPLLVADFHAACDQLGIGYRRKGITTHLKGAGPLVRELGMWGKKAVKKEIPAEVFRYPKEKIVTFLRVFFSCDGGLVKKHGVCVNMDLGNKRLLRQIGHLLTRFGVVWRLSFRPKTCNGKRFKAWRLAIDSAESVHRFLTDINMLSYKNTPPVRPMAYKSFLDKLPWQIAKRLLAELAVTVPDPVATGTVKRGGYVRRGEGVRRLIGPRRLSSIRTQIAKKKPIMRQSFSAAFGHPVVDKYLNADVLWDEVKAIKAVGKKHTYDLGVPDLHNFVANDCVVHNTFWLQEMGWQAMMQGCNVAWFACGDMSRDQMLMRMACRAARTPIDDAPYRYPKAIEPSGGAKETTADLEDRTPLGPLTYKEAKAKLDKLGAKYGKDRIKLAAYPNDTVTVPQLDAHLKRWEANYGWTADVVVIDYADILAPINGQADTRDQINATWKRLRALSQSRHCLVVTATQVKASGYKKELLDKSDFADDKRKFAHVTGMVAINQKGEEKDHQIQRLNWTVLREGEFSESKCLFVAGCFAIANPLVQSTF